MLKQAFSGVIGALLCASAASADVVVLGNTETGAVVIRGNFEDGTEADAAVAAAKVQQGSGWTQLFADNEPGWGAVACVKHDGAVYFSQVNGQKTDQDAIDAAKAGAQKFIEENGGGEILSFCAPAWNNRGQRMAFGGSAAPAAERGVVDHTIDLVKGTLRKAATSGEQKPGCVPPEPFESQEAKLRPIGNGTAPLDATQPQTKSTGRKVPANTCPFRHRTVSGVRG